MEIGVRVFSWNTAGRVGCLEGQIERICARRPDIVCLQEVRIATAPKLRAGLRAAGLENSVNSFDLATDHSALTGPRQTGELIVS
jgi:exonuclease III